MIFVDTNIFMYAVGGEHPNKGPCIHFFEKAVKEKQELVINAEVLQEILYRFWALKRKAEGLQLCDYARKLSSTILAVTSEDVKKAQDLLTRLSGLSPRDAIHVATMKQHRLSTLVSYDKGFDQVEEIKRIEPK